MRTLTFCLFFALGLSLLFGQDAKIDVSEVFSMTPTEREKYINTLPDEQKQDLAKRMRQFAEAAFFPEQFEIARVQVGDDVMVSALVERYLHGKEDSAVLASIGLGYVKDPTVIGRLMPALSTEYTAQSYDRATGAADIIAKILPKMPELTEEVRSWSKDLELTLGEFRRQIFLEWWKQNSDQFEKGNYNLVHPGALAPEPDSYRGSLSKDGKIVLEFKPGYEWTPVVAAADIGGKSVGTAAADPVGRGSAAPGNHLDGTGSTEIGKQTPRKRWSFQLIAAVLIASAFLIFARLRRKSVRK